MVNENEINELLLSAFRILKTYDNEISALNQELVILRHALREIEGEDRLDEAIRRSRDFYRRMAADTPKEHAIELSTGVELDQLIQKLMTRMSR